ncbi:MAG: AMP-binding protein, partial [Nevskia sp.]|nr:AMP-binding protein [Nevskia sp.]
LARWAVQAALRRRLAALPRLGLVGDAPLPREVDEDLRALGFTVLEGYGSTEQVVSCVRRRDGNTPGTIGEPLPQVELRVVDRGLREVGPGEVGQLAVAGPNVCLGYHADEVRDAASFAVIDGRRFLLSGDLGWRDRGGRLVFVGRVVNVLRAAAGPVYPELTENALRNSPCIEQAMLYARRPEGTGVLVAVDPRHIPAAADPVEYLRGEIRATLAAAGLDARQIPTHFIVAARPFRVGDELTVTLKLRREATYSSLCAAAREHSL